MNFKKYLPLVVGALAGVLIVKLFSGVGVLLAFPLFFLATAAYSVLSELKSPSEFKVVNEAKLNDEFERRKQDIINLGFLPCQIFSTRGEHLMLAFVHEEKPIRAFLCQTNTVPVTVGFNFDSHVEGEDVDLTTTKGRCVLPSAAGEYLQTVANPTVGELFKRHESGMRYLESLGKSFKPVVSPTEESLTSSSTRHKGQMLDTFRSRPFFYTWNALSQIVLTTDPRYQALEVQLGEVRRAKPGLRILAWVCLALLVIGGLGTGGIYLAVRDMIKTDPTEAMAVIREVLPGAEAPEGYAAFMASTNPIDGTVRASMGSDKLVPFKGVPEEHKSKALSFHIFHFTHNNSETAKSLFWTSMRLSDARGREILSEEKEELSVGGQPTSVKKFLSKDESGKTYMEYRIDVPQGNKMTFLLISGLEENFDHGAMQAFLDDLAPLGLAKP